MNGWHMPGHCTEVIYLLEYTSNRVNYEFAHKTGGRT